MLTKKIFRSFLLIFIFFLFNSIDILSAQENDFWDRLEASVEGEESVENCFDDGKKKPLLSLGKRDTDEKKKPLINIPKE